ncbi:MAG: hypothetical protein OXC57_03950 [Rhodobacteraceae bacterium]|nr:hypothetical protein [Paracoccaceae bacterium]
MKKSKSDSPVIVPKTLEVDKFSPEFKTNSQLKNARLNAKDFEALKQAYDNCCATCGAQEGETSSRYGNTIIKLQQGHMDPHKDGNDMKNIIPQCQYCNRAYLQDFTFDEKGRVHAITSVEPVKRANETVQDKVYNWLKSKEKNNEAEKQKTN